MVFEDSAAATLARSQWESCLTSSTFAEVVHLLSGAMIPAEKFSRPMQKSVAASEQRSFPMGDSRAVADASSIEEHIERAQHAPMPSRDPSAGAPADLKAAVAHVASFQHDSSALAEWRRGQAAVLADAQRRLAPLSSSLASHTPAHIASAPVSLDPLLVEAMAVASGMPNTGVGFNLLCGAVMVGDVPDTGVFRPAPRCADISPETFDHRSWADSLHDSIRRRGNSMTTAQRDSARAVLAKSMDEAKEGWCSGPLTRDDVRAKFPSGYWPTRRFGVLQKGAVRPCDDARESQQNAATSLREALTNTNAELPASIASLFYELLGELCFLKGGSDDWRKAYRQCGARDPACQVVACWDPDTRRVVYFVIGGMAFGQLAAVNNFNLVAALMTRFARLLFAVCCGNYFDDYVVVEPDFAGSTGQHSLLALHTRCGFLLDRSKHDPMARAFTFVGVQHDLSQVHRGCVSLKILPERAERVSSICTSILAANKLFPAQSASLRGKLYFSCCTAFGRVGRAALQPLVQRQFSKSTAAALAPEEVHSLKFFIALLAAMPPRVIDLASAKPDPVLVWSDASYENSVGRIGFVAFFPWLAGESDRESLPACILPHITRLPFSGFVHSDAVLSPAFIALLAPKAQQIGQCELTAGIAPYLSLPDLFRGREVLHWIDNSSAGSALIKGYSGKPDSAHLTNIFHMFNCGLRARVWFEYVESKANVADLPSRGEFSYLLHELLSVAVPMRVPEPAEWDAPLSHWRDLATSSVRKRVRSHANGRQRKRPGGTR